jgi:hypothetical protein
MRTFHCMLLRCATISSHRQCYDCTGKRAHGSLATEPPQHAHLNANKQAAVQLNCTNTCKWAREPEQTSYYKGDDVNPESRIMTLFDDPGMTSPLAWYARRRYSQQKSNCSAPPKTLEKSCLGVVWKDNMASTQEVWPSIAA